MSDTTTLQRHEPYASLVRATATRAHNSLYPNITVLRADRGRCAEDRWAIPQHLVSKRYSRGVQRRKRRMTFNEPGHAHELTFSCYRRLPLLTSEQARRLFLQCLDAARKRLQFKVWAYVTMPEHVHLLISPLTKDYRISRILMAVKSSFAKGMLEQIRNSSPTTLAQLRVRRRDGTSTYRFWQAGGGYDRNLFSPKAIHACIAYIHSNPVRRGLCETELDWEYSSCRWYLGLEAVFAVDQVDVVKMLT